MNIIAIIGIIIGIIGIILIISIIIYNKFQWFIIKLNKGETILSTALDKKYNILLRYIDFLKTNLKIKNEEFEEFNLLNTKIPINKLNKKINEMNNAINKVMDNNENLLKEETIININKELLEVNISINGSKKYYNDNLIIYNQLVNSFPSKIIALLFRYKEKDFLDEEIKEELKILDEDNEKSLINDVNSK